MHYDHRLRHDYLWRDPMQQMHWGWIRITYVEDVKMAELQILILVEFFYDDVKWLSSRLIDWLLNPSLFYFFRCVFTQLQYWPSKLLYIPINNILDSLPSYTVINRVKLQLWYYCGGVEENKVMCGIKLLFLFHSNRSTVFHSAPGI